MKELGEALKLIFGKIADFFDIFDLSFFVSGIASASSVALYLHLAGSPVTTIGSSTLGIVIGALACYVLGLVSFASGRWLRMSLIPFLVRKKRKDLYDSFDAQFRSILSAHGLKDEKPFSEYLDSARETDRGIWRLYVRLWAEIRHSDSVTPSLQLLKRYWVMAATYDGIAISMALWALLLLAGSFGWGITSFLHWEFGVPLAILLLLFGTACLREAGRFLRYQVEELVASIAAVRNRIAK